MLAGIVAAVLAAVVLAPVVTSASRGGGDPSAERERVRAEKAVKASEVDALKATDAEVEAALAALEENVRGQEALLGEARRAAAEAREAHEAALAAVQAKQVEIEQLREEIREFAVQAFVHPPADDALAALNSADPGEAAAKRALLEVQNVNDADLLDQLTAAEEDLEVQRRLAQEASERADAKEAEVADRLDQLTVARDQQAAYAVQVEQRLERALAEAAVLEERDAELSAEIRKQQAELARRAAVAAAARRSSGGGGAPSRVISSGPLSQVSCPNGGSITVAAAVASSVQSMLNAANADGVALCGGGYRDPSDTARLREANGCPDVYYSSPSTCRVPTARPGTSMHEQGRAIDFNNCSSRSTACYQWLSGNAASYGWYNLPSEPWHWSTNGN